MVWIFPHRFLLQKKDTDKAKGSGTKGVYIPTKSMSKHSIQYLLENVNKKDEIVKEGNTKNGVTQASPSSAISVSDLFALVNKKKTLLKRRAWLKTTQTCRQQTISLQILYPLLSKMSINKS